MSSEQPWIPLSIMLSMYGSRISSKLLFRYPYDRPQSEPQPLSSYRKLTSSTLHLSARAVGSVSDSADDKKQAIQNEKEQLDSYRDEVLGHILSPGNTKICGKKFDVKINGIRFVGYPLVVEQRGSILSKYEILKEALEEAADIEDDCPSMKQKKDSTLLSFNVVFVLRAVAEYGIVTKYQELALRLGLAMRFEEKCTHYLTEQTRLMLGVHDEMSLEPEHMSEPEQAYATILRKSRLARDLRAIYNDLCKTGIVSIHVNDSTHVSFCLAHKVHNLISQKNVITVSSVEKAIDRIRPYHGILIFDKREIMSLLPDDYSPSLTRLLTVYDPTKSLQSVASEADLPLAQIYRLTSQLVYWGKACIIYPLCDSNMYVLAPSADLSTNSELSQVFLSRFGMNLAKVLSYFSLPMRISEFQTPLGTFFGDEDKLVKVVFWLLQHRFLIQMHTYIFFMPPDSTASPEGARRGTYGSESDRKEINQLVSNLPQSHRKAILSVPAANDLKDLRLFLNLTQYFDGNHHVEEIMYNENLARHEVLTILDKFCPILLTTIREDGTTAAFCMQDS